MTMLDVPLVHLTKFNIQLIDNMEECVIKLGLHIVSIKLYFLRVVVETKNEGDTSPPDRPTSSEGGRLER